MARIIDRKVYGWAASLNENTLPKINVAGCGSRRTGKVSGDKNTETKTPRGRNIKANFESEFQEKHLRRAII